MTSEAQHHEDDALVQDLILALSNKSGKIRSLAATLLGQHGKEAQCAAPQLVECLRDPNDSIKLAAAGALAKLRAKPESAVPVLINLIWNYNTSEPVTYGRYALEAIDALADFGPLAQDATPSLITIVTREQKPETRQLVHSAINALGEIGPAAQAATIPLATLLANNVEHFIPISFALAKIGVRRPALPPLLDALYASYHNGEPASVVQEVTLKLIVGMGAEAAEAIPALKSLLELPSKEEFQGELDHSRDKQPKRGRGLQAPSSPGKSRPPLYVAQYIKNKAAEALTGLLEVSRTP